MANFLSNLGAAFQGQQNYQTWETQQQQAKLRIEAEKENLSQIKEAAEEAKAQRKRQPQVAQGYLDYLTQGISPPPPNVQAPAPGQASVPMVQPQQPVQYGQRPIGPDMGLPQQGLPPVPPGGVQPMPQGGPPGPPQGQPGPQGPQQGQQGPQMPSQGPQGGPPQQPPFPPYRTVQGSSQPGQPGQPGIPPPPQQAPRPNSMSLEDAAQFIKARGITDPVTSLQILDKLSPYLDQKAQQQANQLKQQQLQQEKEAALKEKAREADQNSRDKRYTTDQQAQWHQEALAANRELRLIGLGIAQQNANTKAKEAGGGAGVSADGKPGPGVEAAAWNYLLKNQSPPARGGLYGQTMAYVEQIAKENNMSVQELTSASADVKTKLQAKKNFEVRAQNMERAENQILAELPVVRDTASKIDLSNIPLFAKGGLAALRQTGDPRVTQLDQALHTVFNEFQGIITGNPGTLNVSDVQDANRAIENARTPKQLEAALQGIERIMGNAKKSLAKTRKDIIGDINSSFKKEGLSGEAKPEQSGGNLVFSNAAELQAAIKSGKIKKGQTFNDPNGNPHTVN